MNRGLRTLANVAFLNIGNKSAAAATSMETSFDTSLLAVFQLQAYNGGHSWLDVTSDQRQAL